MPKKRIYLIGIVIIVLAIIFGMFPFLIKAYWRLRENNPIQEGAFHAQENGCFNCHLPWSGKAIKNPHSQYGTIPMFYGGSLMMYISDRHQVAEYITYGHLKGKEPSAEQLIKMPAFGSRIADDDIEEVGSYVLAASNYDVPDEGNVSEGLDVALEYGCFSCHGVAGSGGANNPGSLKGYIPGWLGPDFQELVKDDNELNQWIEKGYVDRFQNSRLAHYFLERQAIHMPAFGKLLTPAQINNLKIYLRWQREHDYSK